MLAGPPATRASPIILCPAANKPLEIQLSPPKHDEKSKNDSLHAIVLQLLTVLFLKAGPKQASQHCCYLCGSTPRQVESQNKHSNHQWSRHVRTRPYSSRQSASNGIAQVAKPGQENRESLAGTDAC